MGADSIERDILLRMKASAELGAIDTALTKLTKLQEQVERLRGLMQAPFDFSKVSSQPVNQVTKAVQNLAGATAEATGEQKRLLEQFERLKTVSTTTRSSAEGQISVLERGVGPYGSGLSGTKTDSGAISVTEDTFKARKEQYAADLAAVKNWANGQRELGSQRMQDMKAEGAAMRGELQYQFGMRRRYLSDWDAAKREYASRDNAAAAQARKGELWSTSIDKKNADAEAAALQREIDLIAKETQMRQRASQARDIEARQTTGKDNALRAAQEREGDLRVQEMERAATQGGLWRANQERAMYSDTQYRANGRSTFQAFASQPGVTVTSSREIDPATNSFTRYSTAVNRATGETLKLHDASGKLSYSVQQNGSMWGEMLGNVGKVAMWTVATGAVFGTIAALKEGVQVYAAFEKQTVMMARVGQQLGSTQAEISAAAKVVTRDILDLKVAYGSTGDEALRAGVIFSRLGQSSEGIKNSVEATLQVSKLTGMNAESAAKLLEALQLQFQLPAGQLPRVVDGLVKVDTLSRVTMSDLLEAGSRTAGVWREAGGTLENMVATVAVVADRTGRTGAEIGNALKFISARLATPQTQQKIFDLSGIEMVNAEGKVKPIIELLDELSAKWNTLTEAQQQELTVEIAGARQRNILVALLDGMKDLHSKEAAQLNATGEAARQTAMELTTLTEKWKQLTAAMEQAANQGMDSPLGSLLKFSVDEVTKSTESISLFLKAMKGGWQGMKGDSEALGTNPNDLPAMMRNSPMRAILGFVKVYYDRISGLDADRAKLKKMQNDDVSIIPIDLALPEAKEEREFPGLQSNVKRLENELPQLKDQTKVKLQWDEVLGISALDIAQRKLATLNSEKKKLLAEQESVPSAIRDQAWNNDAVKGAEQLKNVTKEIGEQEAKVTQEQQKQNVELFKEALHNEDRISKARARAQAAVAMGGKKNAGENIVAAEVERATIAQRLNELRGQQAMFQGMNVGPASGLAGPMAAEVGREILIQEKALREANANIEVAKYDTLRKQTEEGRRQLEQAEKKLGLMSSEDLMRTRIAAGEYASGKLKGYSESQWMNMPQEERQRIEKTMPGLMPKLTFGLTQEQGMNFFTDQGREKGSMSVSNLAGTINTATLAAQTVTINGGTPAPQTAAVPPAGAMNLMVNLGGIDTKADQLANQIALRVQAVIQKIIDENTGRVQQAAKNSIFKAGPRSN